MGVSGGRERPPARGAASPAALRRGSLPGGAARPGSRGRTTACFWARQRHKERGRRLASLRAPESHAGCFLEIRNQRVVSSAAGPIFERQASNWREGTQQSHDGTACPEDNIPGENY